MKKVHEKKLQDDMEKSDLKIIGTNRNRSCLNTVMFQYRYVLSQRKESRKLSSNHSSIANTR